MVEMQLEEVVLNGHMAEVEDILVEEEVVEEEMVDIDMEEEVVMVQVDLV